MSKEFIFVRYNVYSDAQSFYLNINQPHSFTPSGTRLKSRLIGEVYHINNEDYDKFLLTTKYAKKCEDGCEMTSENVSDLEHRIQKYKDSVAFDNKIEKLLND